MYFLYGIDCLIFLLFQFRSCFEFRMVLKKLFVKKQKPFTYDLSAADCNFHAKCDILYIFLMPKRRYMEFAGNEPA